MFGKKKKEPKDQKFLKKAFKELPKHHDQDFMDKAFKELDKEDVNEAGERSFDDWVELTSLTASQDEDQLMDAVMNDEFQEYMMSIATSIGAPESKVYKIAYAASNITEIPDSTGHGHRIRDPRARDEWQKDNEVEFESVGSSKQISRNLWMNNKNGQKVCEDEGAFTQVADALYNERPDLFTEHGDEFVVGTIEDVLKSGKTGNIEQAVAEVIRKLEWFRSNDDKGEDAKWLKK